MAGEGVGDDVGAALPVYDGEVEIGEELQPVRLTAGEMGLGVDVLDCPVVGYDGEVAAVEVVAPNGEALDDGEELALVVEVLLLGGSEAGRVIGDDALIGTRSLCQEGTGRELGGVGMQGEGLGEVGGSEDGGGGEGELEVLESGDISSRPSGGPLVGVVQHVVEGGGDGGVVAHAAAEEVGHAEEGAELGDGGGLGPAQDRGDLARVGGDAGGGDDVADEVDLGDSEVAFGGVGIEVVGGEEGEGGAKMGLVVFHVAGEHQDVVEVDDDE